MGLMGITQVICSEICAVHIRGNVGSGAEGVGRLHFPSLTPVWKKRVDELRATQHYTFVNLVDRCTAYTNG